MADLDQRIAAEIAALHVEFERWLRGESDSFARIEASLASDFTIVPPGGGVVSLAPLLEGLRREHGERRIRIRIENVILRWHAGDAALATYEEWHDHEDYTTARAATVLFSVDRQAPGGLLWRHVHETFQIPPPT